ncbi:hypothetical protein C0995_014426 [Termitomyces sp. Mi166|nr:hypothetical protein C0995_014426 [Termitomyces sp. Mi166\
MAFQPPNPLPSSVENTKFRILVVGRSGVGKSSLISNIFNISVNGIDIAHDRPGRANIQDGHTFHENQRLILHDSNGFEAGSQEQWGVVEEFIREKSNLSNEDQLHAIWLCIETPRTGSRLLQRGDERLLELADEVEIPVITVFTKYDFLVKERLKRTDAEKETNTKFPKIFRIGKKPSGKDRSRQINAESEAQTFLKELIKRIEMLRNLFEATQKGLHVKESLMPLAMAQQISAKPKVNYSIELQLLIHFRNELTHKEWLQHTQKVDLEYWKELGSSPYFEGQALVDCLRRIHEDIITVWNFTDPDKLAKLLSRGDFFAQMLDLIQPLAPTIFGSELAPSKSVVDNPWFKKVLEAAKLPVIAIKFFINNYQATPQTAQCLAAYIIDLTLILYDLFVRTLQTKSQRSLDTKLVMETVKWYKDYKSRLVHGDICDSSTPRNTKGYIADLIYKWLDTSAPATDVSSPQDFVSQLQVILQDKSRYKRLLASRDEDAQKLLDLFQWLLDVPDIDGAFKRELIIGTQRLCKDSGLYPTCYSLNGIKITEKYPVNGGGFADIYRGEFQGRPVCLKLIRLFQSTDIKNFMKHFSREAILWSQLLHPHILPIYGVYWSKNRICLVSPWMERGNVREYLKTEKNSEPILLVLDITRGLRYLHGRGIVHGDLKGVNVLVDQSGRAYLADFGLSFISDANPLLSLTSETSNGGSLRWQAPELLDGQPFTYMSDIYAWSCVCYEIFTGNLPFHDITNNNTVLVKVMQGHRPERPSDARGLTDSVWELMRNCWAQEPNSRPTVDMVSSRLADEPFVDTRPNAEEMMTPARFRTAMLDKSDFSRARTLLEV